MAGAGIYAYIWPVHAVYLHIYPNIGIIYTVYIYILYNT